MLLIGMLVCLLVPVISQSYRRGKEAAEITEINSLSLALQQFKDRYGVYPPSQIILREDGDYSTATLPVTGNIGGRGNFGDGFVDYPAQGAGGVFLRSVSIEYLRRIWPQLQLNTGATAGPAPGMVTSGPNQYISDWNGSGFFDNTTFLLSGDECLAFFLGGIPAGEPRDNPAIRTGQGAPGTRGFSKDPLNPTLPPIPGTA